MYHELEERYYIESYEHKFIIVCKNFKTKT